jgi:hypothetical protein
MVTDYKKEGVNYVGAKKKVTVNLYLNKNLHWDNAPPSIIMMPNQLMQLSPPIILGKKHIIQVLITLNNAQVVFVRIFTLDNVFPFFNKKHYLW